MSRPAPFSLRLNDDERQRLESQAVAMPLASYIKSVVFDAKAPVYRRRRKNKCRTAKYWPVQLVKRCGRIETPNIKSFRETVIVDQPFRSSF